MEYPLIWSRMKISDRMASMNPSAIREMVKAKAEIYLSAGAPAPDLFPSAELSALAEEIMREDYLTAFKYGITEGYDPLRDIVRNRMSSKYNVGGADDEVIITTGGQQGLDLSIICLTNEGDTVASENPSFVGGLNDFRAHNTNLISIPMEADGMDLNYLEKVLKTEKKLKMIYTISTFQNPSGITMSFEKRKRLYELAVKHDVIILEDSPYFELRYYGEEIPNIKALDKTGHVVFVGSFSKTIAPGIRIGYTIGQKDLIHKMVIAKQFQDIHTNLFFMMVVARYMERYDFDAHIKRCCDSYRTKRDLMLQGLEKHMPGCVSFTRPDGGLYVWCELPEGYSGTELGDFTLRNGVAIVPGTCLDVHENPANRGFRLNFSVPSPQQIDRGVQLLAKSVREYLSSK